MPVPILLAPSADLAREVLSTRTVVLTVEVHTASTSDRSATRGTPHKPRSPRMTSELTLELVDVILRDRRAGNHVPLFKMLPVEALHG